MHNVRLIARLDIKAPNLIEGIHLQELSGTQPHPEKSGPIGLQIIRNFISA